ncbi:MAG: hypothetical protein JW709_05270, partial [Sedimentisphaerales bacterium]|nr:hypothetical protein [Sedimentisphaerales bacterium]
FKDEVNFFSVSINTYLPHLIGFPLSLYRRRAIDTIITSWFLLRKARLEYKLLGVLPKGVEGILPSIIRITKQRL